MSTTVVPSDEHFIPDDTFALRLLAARRHLGLTQKEAASLCGMSATTWNEWEHGKSPRNMGQVVEAISKALRVNRDWLMWGLPTSGYMLTSLPLDPGQLALPNMDHLGRPLLDPELAVA